MFVLLWELPTTTAIYLVLSLGRRAFFRWRYLSKITFIYRLKARNCSDFLFSDLWYFTKLYPKALI